VLPLAAATRTRRASPRMLAILGRLFGVAAGLLRLGFITDLLAKPIRYGYMNGIALTVLVSQLPKLFGFSVESEGCFERIAGIVSGVPRGETNVAALALGAARCS
jgi:MFS superfamily sulfate permease-like transporter